MQLLFRSVGHARACKRTCSHPDALGKAGWAYLLSDSPLFRDGLFYLLVELAAILDSAFEVLDAPSW